MMSSVIGIDIGYGETKSFHGSEAKRFPTAVTTMVQEQTFGKVSSIGVNGKEYLVGRNAADSKWAIDIRTPGFVGSPAWLAPLGFALIQHGLDPLQIKGGKILLGLPPGQFTTAITKSLISFVKSSTISRNGYRYDLSSTDVVFVPQGAGIYYSYLHEIEPKAFEMNVAVVDIGHYTIDMVYFKKGDYMEDSTSSTPMGISLLLDDICKEFNRTNKITIGHPEAQKLLVRGEVTFLQEVHRLARLPEIIQAYSEKVSAIIDRYFASLAEKPDIGVAAGGGSLALQGRLKLQNKMHAMREPDPVIANAKGYFYFGTKGDGRN